MRKRIFLLSFLLPIIAHAAISISAEQRSEKIGNEILNSDKPSDLPIAGYSEFFDNENINLIKNIDLSKYQDMKIFTGYGIFDQEQNNCHYIEIPNKKDIDFLNNFKDFKRFNQHSYAISKNRMDYEQCIQLTNDFAGTPVMIDSSAENYFIKNNYSKNSESWIGAYRKSCNDIYLSALNKTQFFLNFKNEDICSEDKRNISINRYGYWNKNSKDKIFSCVIEWNSLDYTRPLKVCAPWWKVYREYSNSSIGLVSENELKRINQADIPVKLNVCTKYNQNAVDLQSVAINRDITCTSYYSATIAPECMSDSHQEQCFVDECGGYIKNACRKKAEDIMGKGYVKGELVINGEKKSVKIKDELKTNVYTCPASPYSNKDCETESSVLIFPKECPESNCQALKECLLTATTTEEKDACNTQNKCIKIYASRDIPPNLSPTGVVMEMYGKCPNGELLSFEPNILTKNNKTCDEYETITTIKNTKEKCVSERTYIDHSLNVAFTASDIYQENPKCLRMDTVEDSQIKTPVTIDITLNGYFKHKITKVNLNSDQEFLFDRGSDKILLDQVNGGKGSYSIDSSKTTNQCKIDLDCSIYQTDEFIDRNRAVLLDNDLKNEDISSIIIENNETFVIVENISNTNCNNYSANHGFHDYQTKTTYTKDPVTGIESCKINLKTYDPDKMYSFLSMVGEDIKYIRAEKPTKESCLKNAICTTGAYNESAYGNSYNSTATCSIVSGETPPDYMDHLKSEAGCSVTSIGSIPSTCDPIPVKETISNDLNGFESILAFEDYVTGDFGYYSNYNTMLPKSNKIDISTDKITGKIVSPLVDISNIIDYQTYVAGIKHKGYKSRKAAGIAETVTMSFIGGSGAVVGSSVLYAGPLGLGAAGIAYVVVALLTPSVSMDSQEEGWAIYKSIDSNYHSIFESRDKVNEDKYVGYDTVVPGNEDNWIYIKGSSSIPKNRKTPYKKMLSRLTAAKKTTLMCSGYSDNEINKMIHPSEKTIISGHPGCKWYDLNCEKSRTYTWKPKDTVAKIVNTIYSGADQTVTFLVPYQGEFKVEAYDKYDTLLSTVDLNEDSFINMNSESELQFAQVKFGYNMQIASGVNKEKSCKSDYMVEWGGGVSGVYEENKKTAENENCVKSNDFYVKDHSAIKIVITPKNIENNGFTFKLSKPLPFANRVFVGTLNKKQIRKYRCYNDFDICQDSDFKEDSE